MSLTAWRICKQKHCKDAFSGEGARRFGGRWNNPGTAIVYVAASQALAVLEMLVHLTTPDLLRKYVLIPVEIEEGMIVDSPELPKNWKIYPSPAEIRQIGDDWVVAKSSVALRMPSTLVPSENNFLLNPRHDDFRRLKIGKPLEFEFDSRFTKPAKPKVV